MDLAQEAEWAQKAQKGDASAFGQIVMRYQRPVYSLCARHLDGAEAEDAAQETFVRAFVHIKAFDSGRPLLPWLLTIARHLSLDRLRKRRPDFDSETIEASVDLDHADAEQNAATHEALHSVDQVLAKLPAPQREALILFHVEGLAYRDIAATLDVPLGTVMTWLHRGRAILRQALTDGPATARIHSGVSP